MEGHLRAQHSALFGVDKLFTEVNQTLLSLYEHRLVNTTLVACPLCKEASPLGRTLNQCFGQHLEEMSLLTLPQNPDLSQETHQSDQSMTPIDTITRRFQVDHNFATSYF